MYDIFGGIRLFEEVAVETEGVWKIYFNRIKDNLNSFKQH
jgi:hypothetical protein